MGYFHSRDSLRDLRDFSEGSVHPMGGWALGGGGGGGLVIITRKEDG